jgi:Flp pilus assembly pilin Flp
MKGDCELCEFARQSIAPMKAILTHFVTDESGEGIFDDPFIAVVVAIGCVASLYFIMHTLGGVYDGVGDILNAATP